MTTLGRGVQICGVLEAIESFLYLIPIVPLIPYVVSEPKSPFHFLGVAAVIMVIAAFAGWAIFHFIFAVRMAKLELKGIQGSIIFVSLDTFLSFITCFGEPKFCFLFIVNLTLLIITILGKVKYTELKR